MLQIRLSNKGSSAEGGGGANLPPVENVTVACPDHLVIADLPVAKSLGSAPAAPLVKTIGRKSRRQLGERVHFCVCCDFPIAVYGRLSPCEHAFCLDCVRSNSLCYLCDERIQKIQTIKMNEGILICAAPHCLKSFLKKDEFESHVRNIHADLLHPKTKKEEEVNESEAVSARKPTTSDSTVQAPPRDPPPPRASMQPKLEPPFLGQIPNFPQQNIEGQQESGLFLPDKHQGVLPETSLPDYANMQSNQSPNIAVPINPNFVLAPPQFSYPQFAPDGSQQLYAATFQTVGPTGGTFDPSIAGQQGNMAFFQGNYEQNPGVLPFNMVSLRATNSGMEQVQGQNAMEVEPRDSMGILATSQPSAAFPPPPPPSHYSFGGGQE